MKRLAKDRLVTVFRRGDPNPNFSFVNFAVLSLPRVKSGRKALRPPYSKAKGGEQTVCRLSQIAQAS